MIQTLVKQYHIGLTIDGVPVTNLESVEEHALLSGPNLLIKLMWTLTDGSKHEAIARDFKLSPGKMTYMVRSTPYVVSFSPIEDQS